MKLKEVKGQRQRRLICETGAMEGYLKDISQRVGEREKERQRWGVGGESREGRRRKEPDGSEAKKKIWTCMNPMRRL